MSPFFSTAYIQESSYANSILYRIALCIWYNTLP
jgi:hypothetical protein